MSAASLLLNLEFEKGSEYYDRRSGLSEADYKRRLQTSTTLYVGNLQFFIREHQLYEFFSKAGIIKNLHLGINKKTFKPCGFCFVEYMTRTEAEEAIKILNLAHLGGKQVRIDWDYGFAYHRRWGRGLSGGQVRDDIAKEQSL